MARCRRGWPQWLWLLALLLRCGIAPAQVPSGATVTLPGARSPDGHFAVSVGKRQPAKAVVGSFCDTYLVAEPGKKVVGLLPEVRAESDGPAAESVSWSPDSRAVAIHYRLLGPQRSAALYRIVKGCAVVIPLPDLKKDSEKINPSVFAHYSFHFERTSLHVQWLTATRFRLLQYDYFGHVPGSMMMTHSPFYVVTVRDRHTHTVGIEFLAVAICELTPQGQCRVVSVKPETPNPPDARP